MAKIRAGLPVGELRATHEGAEWKPTGAEARCRARDLFWIVLLLVPPLLIFPNLGNVRLWQDEAETALLARSVRQHGYPLAEHRGLPISDQPDGADVSPEGVWIWSPWLPHYLTAGSFAVFGESTLAARLPFAVCGWITLLLGYAAFRDWTKDRRLARLAVLLLMGSVSYLLLARQSRYYALVALLSLGQLWAYTRLGRGRSALGFVLSGTGLAYSFPPQLVASSVAMLVHAVVVRRDKRLVGRLLWATASIGALALPFVVYAEPWSRDYRGGGNGFDSWLRYAAQLRAYLVEVHLYAWPFALAIAFPWQWAGSLRPSTRAVARTLMVVLALLSLTALSADPSRLTFALILAFGALGTLAAVLAFTVPHRSSAVRDHHFDLAALIGLSVTLSLALMAGLAPFPFFRYLVGILPLLALATAATLRRLAARRKLALAALVAGFLVCDALQVAPLVLGNQLAHGLRWLGGAGSPQTWNLGSFASNNLSARLLRQPPGTPLLRSLAVEYLGELSHDYDGPVERVIQHLRAHAQPGDVVFTTYEHFPLMFYTDLRIVTPDHVEQLDRLPEWVFVHGSLPRLPERISEATRTRYRRAAVPGHEYPWENIPEPHFHRFRTPRAGKPIVLLRLRETPRASADGGLGADT